MEEDKKSSPYIIEIKYAKENLTAEDLARGAELAKEFYELDNDDKSMPACVESITIRRTN